MSDAKRKQSSRILNKGLKESLRERVLYIDDNGIYINQRTGLLEKYSHDCKSRVKYIYKNRELELIGIVDMNDKSKLVGFTESDIYVIDFRRPTFSMGMIEMVRKFSVDLPEEIRWVLYHPFRETYLVTMFDDIMIELNTEFQPVRRTQGDVPYAALTSLPDYSRNIYSVSRRDPDAAYILRIIGDSGINHRTKCHPCCDILDRPTHRGILTLVNTRSINVFDVHRTSTYSTTYQYLKDPVGYSAHSIHVSPNICVVSDEQNIHVIDYRCGLAQTLSTDLDRILGLWYVDTIGRIYVCEWKQTEQLDDQLHVIDI